MAYLLDVMGFQREEIVPLTDLNKTKRLHDICHAMMDRLELNQGDKECFTLVYVYITGYAIEHAGETWLITNDED